MALSYKNVPKEALSAVSKCAAFYRENPHIFVKEFLNIELHTFQKILIVMMNWSLFALVVAARGIGKSFIAAIFCCQRAILYPGSKIVLASGTRGQAINIIQKINLELKPKSPALAFEIDEKKSRINGTDAIIVFKNGSYIKVVTAGESARGNRAHILIIDEFRLVPKDVVDTILSRFLSSHRSPDYINLSKEERKKEWAKEKNRTLMFSSAYFADSWAYQKCKDVFEAMKEGDTTQFLCGLPYQLSIQEGLLDAEQVASEMKSGDFSEVKWAMEMGAEWFGAAEDAWFDFPSIAKNRRIQYPMLPSHLAIKLNNNQNIRIPEKQPGEYRILSADIALMSSSKHNNDATSILVNQMKLTKAGRYVSNIVYGEALEGAHTSDQALLIRKYFDEFHCDYIVIDALGAGSGIADLLLRDINDPETGEIYPALSCCNNQEMASRCSSYNAPKVIWAIKASAEFNSNNAFRVREGFRSGRIRLLIPDEEAEKLLTDIKGYSSLPDVSKEAIKKTYYDTTLLVNELINLQHEEKNNRVKVYERSGMRKDRYSSLAYNYAVALEIENKLSKRSRAVVKTNDFIIKPPSQGKAVRETNGTRNRQSWY